MINNLNKNIKILERDLKHSKASEQYISVEFTYPNSLKPTSLWIPIEYRRLGISIKNENELNQLLNTVYEQVNPKYKNEWLKSQEKFWTEEHPKANITKSFYNTLSNGEWKCSQCSLPKNNNFARRIQDLKEFGYMISTNKNKYCPVCEKNTSHLMLIPVPRLTLNGNGYETWSPNLRKKIIKTLGNIDVYECKINKHCLPDHKFSEIRWDNYTKDENLDNMSEEIIKSKFQLLTNQRNQEKREICRKCFQTDKRGIIYGINYFYEGNENWDNSKYPKNGKDAELGCIGCAWYDIQRWRDELTKQIQKNKNLNNTLK